MICTQCGTQNPDNGAFCVGCGQALQQAAPQYAPPPQQYAAPAAAPVDDEAKDAQDNKIMGILAYLSWLVLVPIFDAKDSKYAKFHANQGVVLAAGELAIWILQAIVRAIFPYHYSATLLYTRGPIYGILSAVFWIAQIGLYVLAIIGLLAAIKGEKKELPLIGKFKILK